MELFIDQLVFGQSTYVLGATKKGLAYFGNKEESAAECARFFPGYRQVEDLQLTAPYKKQLLEYFDQKRQHFDLPIDLIGTPFQQEVWHTLLQIPFGENTTYSALAEQINHPKAIRAVANAVGRNPLMIVVPCHRVLGKNGRLTGFRGGLPLKRQLLQLEKIAYKE